MNRDPALDLTLKKTIAIELKSLQTALVSHPFQHLYLPLEEMLERFWSAGDGPLDGTPGVPFFIETEFDDEKEKQPLSDSILSPPKLRSGAKSSAEVLDQSATDLTSIGSLECPDVSGYFDGYESITDEEGSALRRGRENSGITAVPFSFPPISEFILQQPNGQCDGAATPSMLSFHFAGILIHSAIESGQLGKEKKTCDPYDQMTKEDSSQAYLCRMLLQRDPKVSKFSPFFLFLLFFFLTLASFLQFFLIFILKKDLLPVTRLRRRPTPRTTTFAGVTGAAVSMGHHTAL